MKPIATDDGTWTINDMTTDYQIIIAKRTGTNATLEINGKERVFEWERLKKTETAIETSKTSSSGPRVAGGVYPPMPGKITEVRVKIGDSVKSGSTVCILEAMKMFNELKTSSSGIVKEVNVEVGSMVTTSDLLVLIE
ncbi:acetyl-CoA carboxylase biotin carboxyl carrier protein subunit [Candidatus Thorarchaeota archaeon]|nr:MAG: acetyl-CoA carboxylase biotin carboxyl carrier protein subunit [Candidatus Thorarchaeota archaeon]